LDGVSVDSPTITEEGPDHVTVCECVIHIHRAYMYIYG
jgi:hypothetical protein